MHMYINVSLLVIYFGLGCFPFASCHGNNCTLFFLGRQYLYSMMLGQSFHFGDNILILPK